MSWIRLDADMPWNDKIVGLPNDTARFAYVKVLCAAKVRGRASFQPETLREILGSHARAIPALVEAHLLDQNEHEIVVHNFEEYQRLALQADRQRRYRERHATVTEASPTGQDGTGRNGTGRSTPSISPPAGFMGYPKKDVPREPGGPVVPIHDGRHGKDCLVCFPVLARDPKP